jgi:thiosulfate/3-mercaptopyruvate sulfurtransferase
MSISWNVPTGRTIACAAIVGAVVGCFVLSAPGQVRADDASHWEHGWIIEPEMAASLIQENEAQLLDARPHNAYEKEHLTGAIHVNWQDFTPDEASARGKLLDGPAIEDEVAKLGISFEEPVLVVGQPNGGWGEGGRVVWMLRTLGHRAVSWVEGGHSTLVASGVSTSSQSPDPEPRKVDVKLTDTWLASRSEVKAAIRDDEVMLLDTRHRREYEGATPYGESRGGHVPTAAHLHFRDLIGEDGRLLPASEIRMLLQMHGITTSTPVIAYCTGGVRSAWMTVVLSEFGYDVKNYAGSMWDWSAAPADAYPLEQGESSGSSSQ